MNEAYVCDYIRTPIGRYGGSLAQIRTDDLASLVIKALMQRNPSIDWHHVDDVIFGCANQAGEDNRNVARMATLLAQLPVEVPACTVNRLCGSGLDAILSAHRSIKTGDHHLVIVGGVEGMSRAPWIVPKPPSPFSRAATIYDSTMGWRFINPVLERIYGTDSMPETAENVADHFKISREDQDRFAYRSQKKAAQAIKRGRFKKEIIPIEVPQIKRANLIFDQDEHPRETSPEKLATLKPLFKDGTVTAGNASGINDGAAAMIIASEKAIKEFDLTPLGQIIGGTVTGVKPRIMGIGPVSATKKLCRTLQLTLDQIDLIELNEAFASQSIAVLRELSIQENDPRINPNGGAISLGHPLGMSGIRIAGTALLELQEQEKHLALATMCIGVGQGIATIFKKV